MKPALKILIIRFSAMGDIIYTTPVIRCLKTQLPNCEIHFLTKPNFKYLVEYNPYINHLHLLNPKLSDTIADLKSQNFDYVIDLHSSLRSAIVKLRLGAKTSTYNKQRFKKWLAIKFKINKIAPTYLVDRYLKTVEFLGVKNDNLAIDYFLPPNNFKIEDFLPSHFFFQYIAFVVGATHFTKRMPNSKVISILKKINLPVVLLGGKDVAHNGIEIANACTNVISLCGDINLNQSVFLIKNAQKVIGFDTGLTHIAEAFDKPLLSIWGSTVPQLLGVQPYLVSKHYEAEVDLPCRPCSKFGLSKCPKGHFNCMHTIDEQPIINFLNQ
ncbi:MAG: glycosyltransferase family 9 protein [Sphingobacteriales bacterium]|nr:MAG: glycosyltransferase family 9 protein [Sphingobacteriales bacterium]